MNKMSEQEYEELRICVDEAITDYGQLTSNGYNFDRSMVGYNASIEAFVVIKLKYDDSMEFLTESYKSDEYNDLTKRYISKLLANKCKDQDIIEDLDDLVREMASDWYKEKFEELVDVRCSDMYQQEMLNSRLVSHIDMYSGETTWVGMRGLYNA